MRFLLPAFLALACSPAALMAQQMVQALPGTTDADRLAEQMRALAANPRDVNALIAAGELSLGLDDLSGAASLFARAEQIAPGNPRIKAGEGAILVRSERPGEALRYFAQAEAAGLDPRGFAADRGLAYDLIGQQERAQRDYRLALKTAPSDETLKRYALSLGISGKRDAALEQLDPLLRKQDRSAWRIRAFVLAMGGDQAGAEKIAATMLPAGMAQGLQPFFERLSALPAADRAFAVHFGEVRTTPERIADARLAPALPMLVPEAAPVALAAVQPNAASGTRGSNRGERRRRDRDREQPGRVALASPAPMPAPATTPSYAEVTRALAQVQPVPAAAATVTRAATMSPVAPVTTRPPMTAATVQPVPTQVAAANAARPPVSIVTVTPASPPPSYAAIRAATVAPAGGTPVAVAAATPSVAPTAASAPAPAFVPAPAQPTPAVPQPGFTVASTAIAATPAPGVAAIAATPAAVTPVAATAPVAVAPSRSAAAPALGPAPAPIRRREQADAVLARIVAGLSIPGSELGVAEPVRAAPIVATAAPAAAPVTPPVDTAARVLAEAKAKEQRDSEAQKALAAKAAADKRAADRKAAADKKALAAKKLADEKKLAEAKEAAEEKKKARANPARIWVQVAGGANEDDLPKAWAAAKALAPALAGRSGWKTPLRATNRVLTGPFKTDAEARSVVNQLTKQGVGAFTFTSDAGQVVEKLSSK